LKAVVLLTTNKNESFHDEKMMKRAVETKVERGWPVPFYGDSKLVQPNLSGEINSEISPNLGTPFHFFFLTSQRNPTNSVCGDIRYIGTSFKFVCCVEPKSQNIRRSASASDRLVFSASVCVPGEFQYPMRFRATLASTHFWHVTTIFKNLTFGDLAIVR